MATGTAVSKVIITADNATAAAFAEVKESLSQLTESGRSFTETLKTGLEALGLEVSISAFKEMVVQTAEAAAAFGLLAEKTGISAKELSGLDFAAQQTGVSSDALQTGLKLLSKNLVDAGNGVRLSADAFKALGVSTKDASGNVRPLGDVLLDIADKFSKSEDGATKSRIAMQLFGRSGTDMIPFLNAGRDGIEQLTAKAEALGITIDGETAEAMHGFEQQLKTVEAQANSAKLALVAGMLPSLEQVIAAFSTGKDKINEFNQIGQTFGTWIKTASGWVYDFAYSFDVAILKAEGFYHSLLQLMTGVAWSGQGDLKAQLAALAQMYADEKNKLDQPPPSASSVSTSGGTGQLHLSNSADAEKQKQAADKLLGILGEASPKGSLDQIDAKYQKMINEVQAIINKFPALKSEGQKAIIAIREAWDRETLKIAEDFDKWWASFDKVAIANVLNIPVESVRTLAQMGQQIQATFKAISQQEKAITDQGKEWGASQFVIDQQLKPLREKEIKDLQQLVDLYQTLAKGAKGADAQVLVEQAKKYEAELDQLKTKAQSFGDILQKDMYQQGLTAFQGIVTQTKSVSDAFKSMALAIIQDIEKMITEMLFFKAITGIMGMFAGPAPSVASVNQAGLGSLSSMKIPGFASGGDFSAGVPMIVGENGPELMLPSASGSIIPNSKLGGNVYNIDARGSQPGVERDIMRAIKASEDRAVVRSVRTMDSRAKRQG